MEQEPIRGAQPRSLVGTYVSSGLMLWQALCAFSLFSSLSSLRDYLDYSGKTSEGNHETGRVRYCHMTEGGFILASGQLPSGREGYTLVR